MARSVVQYSIPGGARSFASPGAVSPAMPAGHGQCALSPKEPSANMLCSCIGMHELHKLLKHDASWKVDIFPLCSPDVPPLSCA